MNIFRINPCNWLRSLAIAALLLLAAVPFTLRAQPTPLRGYLDSHDPSTMVFCNGRYYQYWTGQGILSRSSADKIFWKPGPAVFTTQPAWTSKYVPGFTGLFWAPDVMFFNGQYHLYYAVSTFGSQVSGIGLVTSPTLDPSSAAYKWTDQGPVITSTNGSPYNTIDPSFSWDNSGNLWMAYGSYWNGIYLVQLDPNTGLRISANSPTYQLAYNSSIEASYLWRRGGYYYLFANWGSCCSGVNSTYNIRVGRSTSITGPYLDQDGVNMVSGGGTLFMQGNGKFTGPGHVGILDEGGTLTLTHHFYDANAYAPQYGAYGNSQFASLPLFWTLDDWPYVTNDWSANYRFQADARDENGQYSGLFENGASVVKDPTYGHVLSLNGTNQYVWLPPGTGYAETFVAVVNWGGGAEWQRIFDFGFDTTKTVMMTPASGDNVLRCDINPGGNLQTIQWTHPLPTNVWMHVTLTLDGTRGILYVNGLPVVTNSSMDLLPLYVEPQTNHLGRSKFSADPYFNGKYASFRVYGRALSPEEIIAPIATISQPAVGTTYQPGTVLNFNGSAVDFMSRPLDGSKLTWQISYSQLGQTNLVYGPISGITNGAFTLPLTNTGGGNYIIQLSATDGAGHFTTNFATVTAAEPSSGWTSYFPLTSSAADANGHFNGTLNNGASIVNDLARGNVLSLNGVNQYVSFPAGLSGMKTFMAWVKWNGGANWQRIYDFGNDTNHYTVLTPSASNGKFRLNISVDNTAGEQIADAPTALPVGVWTHVAVVMNGTNSSIYSNGIPVATNLFANLLPGDLQATNIYIGKSQWPADPYFSGEISSVRVFSRALTSNEITAPQITITQPASGAVYQPGDSISFSGSANDFNDNHIAVASLTWSVYYVSATTTNLVSGPLSNTATGSFSIPSSGNSATNGSYKIQLVAADVVSRTATNSVSIYPAPQNTAFGWASFYPFTSGAQDASNNFNGTLANGASIVSDLGRGFVLNLNSSASQYVSLPAGATSAQTVSGWIKWSGGNEWQRIFDFGEGTEDFFFLTTSDANGLPQCGITADAAVYVQTMESPTALSAGQWTPFAVVMNGREGILYLNGNAVAVNNSVNLLPSDIAASVGYFGRSEFSADPYFNGRLSAFRLNSQPESLSQLLAPLPTITQPTPGTLFAGGQPINYAGTATDFAGNSLAASTYTWSGEYHSNGIVYSAFGPITNTTTGSYLVPSTTSIDTNNFYRIFLTATDTNGYQTSVSTDVEPQTSQWSLASVPSGMQLVLNGQPVYTPATIPAVVGMAPIISAPASQTLSGIDYPFVLWSDGGAETHAFTIPSTNVTLTAAYLQPTLNSSFASGSVNLSWPQWASPLTLMSTTNLGNPSIWTPVAIQPTLSGGLLSVQLPMTNSKTFYRLQSQ